MLPTEIAVKIKLEHAEIVDQFSYNNQSWVMGTRWVRYGDECSVRMNFDVLKNLNPCHDKFFDDLREQVLSPKEARAFFDFASAIFNRSFMGLDLFHESVRNGLKFGFTTNWDSLNTVDSEFDFNSRTAFPGYQNVLYEVARGF